MRFAVLIALLFLSACADASFFAANFPTYFDDTGIVHDVAFGPEPAQKLDIYIPANSDGRRLDVVVFLYGGRWSYGEKEDYRFVAEAFAGRGFVVVIPDYRKYPEVRFPVFVQDGAKAVAWVYDNIAAYHGDPQRIHIAGHSAGAHIGVLLTADAHYLAAEKKRRSAVIHDFAGLAGPYAFTPDEPDLKDMFGPPRNYPQMQVTTFIDGKQPPMLLLYGDADKTVEPYNLQKLVRRIRKKGGCVKPIIYHDMDHNGLVGALSWYNPDNTPVLDDMTRFFRTANCR